MTAVGLIFGNRRGYALVWILVMLFCRTEVCVLSVLGYALLWDGSRVLGGHVGGVGRLCVYQVGPVGG